MISRNDLRTLVHVAVEKQIEASKAADEVMEHLGEHVRAAAELVDQPYCDPELAEMFGAYAVHICGADRLAEVTTRAMPAILFGLHDRPLLRQRLAAAYTLGNEMARAECGCATCKAKRAQAVKTVEEALARTRGEAR